MEQGVVLRSQADNKNVVSWAVVGCINKRCAQSFYKIDRSTPRLSTGRIPQF